MKPVMNTHSARRTAFTVALLALVTIVAWAAVSAGPVTVPSATESGPAGALNAIEAGQRASAAEVFHNFKVLAEGLNDTDARLARLEAAITAGANGNVGIGTTNPASRLDVAGEIRGIRIVGDGAGLKFDAFRGLQGANFGFTSVNNPDAITDTNGLSAGTIIYSKVELSTVTANYDYDLGSQATRDIAMEFSLVSTAAQAATWSFMVSSDGASYTVLTSYDKDRQARDRTDRRTTLRFLDIPFRYFRIRLVYLNGQTGKHATLTLYTLKTSP